MANNLCRLRKYRRKKNAALTRSPHVLDGKTDRLLMLYWRYHHKIYGKRTNLWDDEDASSNN